MQTDSSRWWKQSENTTILVGMQCTQCNKKFLPKRNICPNCNSKTTNLYDLPAVGHLVTWTITRVIPEEHDEDEMVISEGVPNQQCEDCNECWANEWESAKVGKGKACADRRRLALVVAGKDDKMELKILNIPPTSLKSWKGFVNEVDALGLNVMQAAVNISFDEDSTAAQMPLLFEFVDEVQNEKALNVTAAMLEPAYKLIEQIGRAHV